MTRPNTAPTNPTSHKKPLRIAVLAYPACMGTEVFAIADVLLIATHIASHMAGTVGKTSGNPFELQVIGLGGPNVQVAGGIAVGVKRPRGVFDLLIVPGQEVSQPGEWAARLALLAREVRFIKKMFARGTSVASICVGAFLLGEAGLLAGRKATTAWLFAHELASRYPDAELNTQAVLIEDGGITTTGAVSSAFDLAIHLVKRTLGPRVAAATARVALLQNPRDSQLPYVDDALLAPSAPPFSRSLSHNVAQWQRERLAIPYKLESLASAFHVSSRTLLRRVKTETGQSPLSLLQNARVEKAKELLTSTAWSVARITEEVGYTDLATFSRLFASRVGETPARYRRR